MVDSRFVYKNKFACKLNKKKTNQNLYCRITTMCVYKNKKPYNRTSLAILQNLSNLIFTI